MQYFNIGKYVWFDVLGIPGNTAIYIAASVQKLKTGKKEDYKRRPSQTVWNQSIQDAFIVYYIKIMFAVFMYLFPQIMILSWFMHPSIVILVNRVVGTTLFHTFLSQFVDYCFRGRGGNSISAYGI